MTSFQPLRRPAADQDGTARVPRSAGVPLDDGVRRSMEARLGAPDLSMVRVHSGPQADRSARALQAHAFTVGRDVVFASGQYAPDTPVGQFVLAHELAHVIQQGVRPAHLRAGPGPAAAEREAHAAARNSRAGSGTVVRPGSVTAGVIQCFNSFEHIDLGDATFGGPTGRLLLACHARDLPQHAKPTIGWPPVWKVRYMLGSHEQRRVITEGLTYGQILALAGDFYAAVDPASTGTSVAGTLQQLNRASLVEIYDLIPLIHSPSTTTEELETATGGRYVELAKQNVSHFSNVAGGHDNLSTWREGHTAALMLAAAGDVDSAWAMNAVADHFLTDAFAAGHLRPNRAREVQSRLGQLRSKLVHDLDNKHGLPVHNRAGDSWDTYGDDRLGEPANRDGRDHVRMAVELSKADIQAVITVVSRAPDDAVPVPTPPYAAERLVPAPDRGAPARWDRDDVDRQLTHIARSEGPDMVTPNGDTRAREWVARQGEVALRDMPLGEKVRMVNRMFSGWVSDEDLTGIERLYTTSTAGDRGPLTRIIGAQISDLWSIGQRTRLRILLSQYVPVDSR